LNGHIGAAIRHAARSQRWIDYGVHSLVLICLLANEFSQ